MSNVSEWSTSAASNNSAAPNGAPEGMAPSGVNDVIRENMAATAKWYKDTNGSLVTGGTSTAITLTTNNVHTALSDQPLIVCEIGTTSGASPTLQVDSLAAKSIIMPDGTAIPTGALRAGAICIFGYEAGADSYVLVGGATGTAGVKDTGTDSGDIPVLGATGLAAAQGGVPIGTILDYAGSSAPTGYLSCDGSAVSRATYSALFTAISTTWGVGDGSTTFNVPDLRGRTAIGSGTGTDLTARTLGASDGAETHTLTQAELPAARLFIAANTELSENSADADLGAAEQMVKANAVGNAHGYDLTGSATEATRGRTSPMGDGDAHDNMQPYAVVTKIIRAL